MREKREKRLEGRQKEQRTRAKGRDRRGCGAPSQGEIGKETQPPLPAVSAAEALCAVASARRAWCFTEK